MQMLDLGRLLDDGELEGVVLGLVYTAAVSTGGWGRGRGGGQDVLAFGSGEIGGKGNGKGKGGGEKGGKEEEEQCLQNASRFVGEGKVMEGVMELGYGGGEVSFLVYRVD